LCPRVCSRSHTRTAAVPAAHGCTPPPCHPCSISMGPSAPYVVPATGLAHRISVLVPEAISSRTAVMSFQVPMRCLWVESLDMSQALTRRRDGAKCFLGEGKSTVRGRWPRREGGSHQGRAPTGKAPLSYNSAETPKWPLAPTALRAPRGTARPILERRATFAPAQSLRCDLCEDMHSPGYRKHPNGHRRN